MKERPKTGAFLLIAVAILSIYLLKGRLFPTGPSPRAVSSSARSSFPVPNSAGARLVFGLPVDINSATAGELELLPGIGPVLAKRIIEARSLTSGFSSLAELERIKGLSPTRLKGLTPYITIEG